MLAMIARSSSSGLRNPISSRLWFGWEYADLLEAAGVDTVPELAQRNAENLHAKLGEVNGEKNLVRRLPSLAQVQGWVAEAKGLERVVTY